MPSMQLDMDKYIRLLDEWVRREPVYSNYYSGYGNAVYPYEQRELSSHRRLMMWKNRYSIVKDVVYIPKIDTNKKPFCNVYIKGTIGPNNWNFKESFDEKIFVRLVKNCPPDINVVFFDMYGQKMKEVISNEP